MSDAAPPFEVWVTGVPADHLHRALLAWRASYSVVAPSDGAAPLPDLDRTGVAWLGPRTRLDDGLRDALQTFAAGSRPAVAVAAHVAEADGVRVPLGRSVVAATRAAARWTSRGPVPRDGVVRERLDAVVVVDVPAGTGAHLRAINDESDAVARLGLALGEVPGWRDLALAPAWGTLRGVLGARGDRRRAVTVAFLESFAPAASAAKLWDALYGGTETGP